MCCSTVIDNNNNRCVEVIPAIYFNEQKNTAQNCISRGLCIDFDSENILHIFVSNIFLLDNLFFINTFSYGVLIKFFTFFLQQNFSQMFMYFFLSCCCCYVPYIVWREKICRKSKAKNIATLNATALHTLQDWSTVKHYGCI